MDEPKTKLNSRRATAVDLNGKSLKPNAIIEFSYDGNRFKVESVLDRPKTKLNSGDNPPNFLMNIVDEAYYMITDRIDRIRMNPDYRAGRREITEQMDFLKDLRDLLKLSESFRDE
jgi:hypothetical protein